MALTPEDVVNKRFQPTKFREGYDQDEVDDFLDEIVVELRRLNQENDELRKKLAESGSAVPASSAAAAPVVEKVPAPVKADKVEAPAKAEVEAKAAELPRRRKPSRQPPLQPSRLLPPHRPPEAAFRRVRCRPARHGTADARPPRRRWPVPEGQDHR